MKFIWEISDIRPGLEICRPSTDVRHIIGYHVGINGDKKYCTIDLRDGAVMKPQTKEELVNDLNKCGYCPRYTFEPHG